MRSVFYYVPIFCTTNHFEKVGKVCTVHSVWRYEKHCLESFSSDPYIKFNRNLSSSFGGIMHCSIYGHPHYALILCSLRKEYIWDRRLCEFLLSGT
jgi:hypothetical protein